MPQSLDFGTIRRTPNDTRHIKTIVAASVIAIGGLAAAVMADIWFTGQAAAQASQASWMVSGPPCPSIDAAWWGKLAIATPMTLSYQGIASERAHGDSSCYVNDSDGHGHAVTPYPVCEFNAPFALHVRTASGEAYFEPGVGKPATISLAGGTPHCVVGASAAAW